MQCVSKTEGLHLKPFRKELKGMCYRHPPVYLYLFLYSSTNYYWKADSHRTESLLYIQWLVRSKGDANELIVCINSKGCFILWFMSCMDMRGKHLQAASVSTCFIYLFLLIKSTLLYLRPGWRQWSCGGPWAQGSGSALLQCAVACRTGGCGQTWTPTEGMWSLLLQKTLFNLPQDAHQW